jgi:hypothetical protein
MAVPGTAQADGGQAVPGPSALMENVVEKTVGLVCCSMNKGMFSKV